MAARLCSRCGNYSRFALGYRGQKVCDACKADPGSRAKYAKESIAYGRARNLAVRRLIDRHPDEYASLLAEERAGQEAGWAGATLREIDDFQRRVEEAVAAGWRADEAVDMEALAKSRDTRD